MAPGLPNDEPTDLDRGRSPEGGSLSMVDDVWKFMEVARQDLPDGLTVPTPVSEALAIELGDEGYRLQQLAESLALRANTASLTELPATDRLLSLRARFMVEELGELLSAMAQGDTVMVADAIADLLYVTIGAGLAFGIPVAEVWAEVQRSNMAKFPKCVDCENGHDDAWDDGICRTCNGKGRVALKDAHGKTLKPTDWTPPDIKGVLARYRS